MCRATTLVSVAAVALFLGACGDHPADDLMGPLPATQTLASRGQPDKALPFHGSGTGWITSQVFAPGFPVERSTFEGRCSIPSDYIVEFSANGEATRLGECTIVFGHCSRMNMDAGTGAVSFDYGDGRATFVAANGDELHGTYDDGDADLMADGTVAWHDTFVLAGGTGRFEGAVGGGAEMGVTDSVTGWTTWEFEGIITYDASN
jgi:hypothetical protein